MTILYIDIHEGELNLVRVFSEEDASDASAIKIEKFSSPAVVSLVEESQSYLRQEPSYESFKKGEQTYGFLVGVVSSAKNTLFFDDIYDFINAGEQGEAALAALLQHALRKTGEVDKLEDCNGIDAVSLLCHLSNQKPEVHDASINTKITALFQKILKLQSAEDFIIVPAEKNLVKYLQGSMKIDDLEYYGCVVVKISKKALTIYSTQDGNLDLLPDSVAVIDQVSILSLLEKLKEQIHAKTGFSSMPLSDKVLLRALGQGSIGSVKSGMYVDLRDEVNELFNNLARSISESLSTYTSGTEQIFGGLFFTGFLSHVLYDKVKKEVEEKMSQTPGVQCKITHIEGGHKVYVNSLVHTLTAAAQHANNSNASQSGNDTNSTQAQQTAQTDSADSNTTDSAITSAGASQQGS